ncbi:MAG: hypothetical protein ING59_09435 [Burkholderiales bacterium]|jgi:hypothetical protein|nr:hypothetical protein [Burkholderiales bacterium]
MRTLYAHTQVGWWSRLLFLIGAVFALVLPPHRGTYPGADLVPWLAALAILVLGVLSTRLTVRIDRDALRVAFGWGWPRRTLQLTDIRSAEVTRTRWYEGWGIRSTRRGWLWNVAGLDAVLVRLSSGKSLLIGTDEPRRLHAALAQARAEQQRGG